MMMNTTTIQDQEILNTEDKASPRVSVVTATYNWSSVLKYAIESVLWQTFPDFEMLVIGDGCTDDSAEVVAAFGDPRLSWHNLETNSGHQSTPNNKGLEMARGSLIAYLGHDDIWHPTHLERLLSALDEANADIAFSLTAQVGPPDSGIRQVRGVAPDSQYSPDVRPPPSSLLHRHGLVAEIGGWKDFRELTMLPEEDWLLRASDAGKQFVAVPELTVWKFPSTWRPGSYVSKPFQEQAECVRRIREEPDFLYREAVDCVIALSLHKTEFVGGLKLPGPIDELPPGWFISQFRQIRGLEPLESDNASTDAMASFAPAKTGRLEPAEPAEPVETDNAAATIRRSFPYTFSYQIARKSKRLLQRILHALLRRLSD